MSPGRYFLRTMAFSALRGRPTGGWLAHRLTPRCPPSPFPSSQQQPRCTIMSPANSVRLLKLADREFHQLTGKPATPVPRRKFKPVKLNAARFDSAWDRKRGAAVRLTAVLLGEDDAALEHRVCGDERARKTYSAAADWLQRESAYLRKVARLLDTAGGRLSSVLGRCQGPAAAP